MTEKIAIIGAGAAGMLAAGRLREAGMDVTVFERNDKPGRKLAITGKGRCNLTNNCTPEEFLTNVVKNPRFMMSSIYSFTPSDTIELFESLGVPLKTERGNRVFPVSDRAYDIVDAMKRYMGVKPVNERVTDIVIGNSCVCGIITEKKKYSFDRVLIATGGASYPLTGSTGDGYTLARQAGHSITPLIPSLIPIVTEEKEPAEMMGLSLRNVRLDIYNTQKKKIIFSEQGEMLFTHFGITGPLVLSASSNMHDIEKDKYKIFIDLKPALDEKTLDTRILNDFKKYQNKDFINSLGDLLPQKMIPVFVKTVGIPETKKVNSITKEERKRIVDTLKRLTYTAKGLRPISEAIVTSGGVDVKEINPKTMESKLIPGLYFAGEVLDVDAYTGGFNLQIAFSTANAAANAIINS
ncbi:MAG: NAD(P)/FAD-dependent oxidoreductase [Ruminococcaceae bacterium]|nr:NAD(P)/FAD-dependent oxidoreductase [Oscillospiraceae bacterium]